jgi:Coiled-coil domain-containing protein 55 (DUF2040)
MKPMAITTGKKYGLVKSSAFTAGTSGASGSGSAPSSSSSAGAPGTKRPPVKLAAFRGLDEDSDDEDEQVIVRASRQIMSQSSFKEVARLQEAAATDDPSIFDYDGVYDDMKKSAEEKTHALSRPDISKEAPVCQYGSPTVQECF